MIEVTLHWPTPRLSPNARIHWRLKARAVSNHRRICWGMAKGQVFPIPEMDGNLVLEYTFNPPNKRSFDKDNLIGRMKSGIDGVCDALKINDNQFKTVIARTGEIVKFGTVVVRIYKDENNG